MTKISRRARVAHALAFSLIALAPLPALAQGAPAASSTAPALQPAELKARLDAVLAASYPADGPGATMVVMHGGKLVYAGARGLADVAAKKPLTSGSVIRIGSLTKQFTAAVVLQLVNEKKLSLDDPLSKFLPGYPAPGGAATVRQLLNHTSGIQSYTSIPGWMVAANTGRAFTTDQLIAEFRDKPAEFQPGARWSYDNSGYVLLGAIIERVTGQPWYRVLEARITRPLGLKTIRFGNPPAGTDWALPYSRGPAGVAPAQAIDMSVPHAAGALVGSAGDMARWAQALHHGRVLPPALYALMTTPTKLPDGTSAPYGFGLGMGKLRGSATLEHSGGIFGGSTDTLYVPSDDLFVAVFANTDRPTTPPGMVMRRAAAIAMGNPFAELTPHPVDAAALEPLFGVYAREGAPGEAARFYTRDGKLWFWPKAAPPAELYAAGDGRFGLTDNALTWLEASGGVIRVHFNGEEPDGRLVRTGPVPPAAAVVAVPRATLAGYVGSYKLAVGVAAIAFGEGDTLTIQLAGQPAFPLEPTGATRFRVNAVGAEIDLDGKTLTIHQGGRDISGPRAE